MYIYTKMSNQKRLLIFLSLKIWNPRKLSISLQQHEKHDASVFHILIIIQVRILRRCLELEPTVVKVKRKEKWINI